MCNVSFCLLGQALTLTLLVEPKTYSSKTVLVRAGECYKALGFDHTLAVVLVGSDVVAGIKLLCTWQKIGTSDNREVEKK